jgi:hypothetical protein
MKNGKYKEKGKKAEKKEKKKIKTTHQVTNPALQVSQATAICKNIVSHYHRPNHPFLTQLYT